MPRVDQARGDPAGQDTATLRCDPGPSDSCHLSDTGIFVHVEGTVLSRRVVLGAALGGLLAACTPDEGGPGDSSGTAGRGGASDGGGGTSEDGAAGSGEGQGEVEEPIEALAAKNPYDAMTITPVADGAMTSWDITYLAAGSPVLRYRLQGEWDGESAHADGYQRLEEVRVLEGAPTLQGQTLMPRSNWEFAFQIDVDGDKQFVPYHGTPTAVAAVPPAIVVDESVISPDDLEVGVPMDARSFALEQTVHARHPARGEKDLVEITTTTTWTADGKLAVSGTWTALEDVVMGSAYGPMLPFSRDIFDEVGTDTSEYLEVDSVAEAKADGDPAGQTLEIDGTRAALIRSSETGWTAAIRWLHAEQTLRSTANEGDESDVFLQLRDDGIAKIYPQVWDQGETVTAGSTWKFGAEWIIVPST